MVEGRELHPTSCFLASVFYKDYFLYTVTHRDANCPWVPSSQSNTTNLWHSPTIYIYNYRSQEGWLNWQVWWPKPHSPSIHIKCQTWECALVSLILGRWKSEALQWTQRPVSLVEFMRFWFKERTFLKNKVQTVNVDIRYWPLIHQHIRMYICAHVHTHSHTNEYVTWKIINKEDRTVEDERGGHLGSSQWLQKNILLVSAVGCALVLFLLKMLSTYSFSF